MRIGYYYRWAIDINLKNFQIKIIFIPVARYLCKGIKKRKHNHKTFSLLPDNLIPYNQISIDLMMHILKLLIENVSTKYTIEQIDAISPDDIFISEKRIHHLMDIMKKSRIKLIYFFQQFNTDRAPPDFHAYTINETITFLLRYPKPEHEHPVRGAYYLSVLFYEMQKKSFRNPRFLFGTASQFCR